MICSNCGTVGEGKGMGMLQYVCAFFLLCCGLIPGLLYAWWVDSHMNACVSCGQNTLVPVDSPKGQQLLKG